MRRALCRLIGHRWHRGPVERIHHHAGGPDLPPRYLLSIVCRRCGRHKTAATPQIVGRVCRLTEDDHGIAVTMTADGLGAHLTCRGREGSATLPVAPSYGIAAGDTALAFGRALWRRQQAEQR